MEIKSLEHISCSFCQQDNYNIKYIKNGFNIVQCKNCKLVYVNPRLTNFEIENLYNGDYFTGKGFDKSVFYKDEFESKKDIIDLQDWDISTLKSLLNSTANNQKLFDIGAGMGLFLWKAKKAGFDVNGLELSPFAAGFVNSLGIKTFNTSIDEIKLEKNYYDVITMKEVIEHLPNPFTSLQKIFQSLKDNGILFLATGNYNCPERKLKGSDWFYFMPEGHLTYFSNRTIKMMLKKVGFRKVLVTNQGDLLMNFLLRIKILEPDNFKPKNIVKKTLFGLVRGINHFISSGMRIYAIK